MVGVACGSPYIVPVFKIPHGNVPIWCEKASPTMVMPGQHSYINNQMQVSGSHNKCVRWFYKTTHWQIHMGAPWLIWKGFIPNMVNFNQTIFPVKIMCGHGKVVWGGGGILEAVDGGVLGRVECTRFWQLPIRTKSPIGEVGRDTGGD